MHKFLDRPLYVFFAYLMLIGLFAILFYFVPAETFSEKLNIVQSIYLSVITITTLGYGDITPINDLGMILTATESILGIVVIGLFLNSSWRFFSKKIEENQAEQLRETLRLENVNKYLSYFGYFQLLLNQYRRNVFEVTTPLTGRSGKQDYNPNFKFSDMQDCLGPSMNLRYGFERSIVDIYYDTEADLVREMKFMLANITLADSIRQLFIRFLSLTYVTDYKDLLISYAKRPREDSLRKLIEGMIKDNEKPPANIQGNAIAPVVMMYEGVRNKMIILDQIEEESKKLDGGT